MALGYKDDTPDPSVYVKFRLTPESAARLRKTAEFEGDEPISVVAWTTTPWTLPGNTYAVRSHRTAIYVARLLRRQRTRRTVLEGRGGGPLGLARTLVQAEVERERADGLERVPRTLRLDRGQNYAGPLLSRRATADARAPYRDHRAATSSRIDDGTGIVHIAPAFGEDDFAQPRAASGDRRGVTGLLHPRRRHLRRARSRDDGTLATRAQFVKDRG